MGVSSPSQGHPSREPSKHGDQERGPSRDSQAAGCQHHSNKHKAVTSSRGSPGPWSGRKSWPRSGMCLPVSPSKPCPRLFPRDAPAPGNAVPAVPAVLAFSSDRSCFAPAVQERRTPRPFLVSAVALELALTGMPRGPGEGGLVLPAERKGSSLPHLCSGCSLLQGPLLPTFLLKTTFQSSKPRLNVSLLAGCLLSLQVRLIFPSDGLLWRYVYPLLLFSLPCIRVNSSCVFLAC